MPPQHRKCLRFLKKGEHYECKVMMFCSFVDITSVILVRPILKDELCLIVFISLGHLCQCFGEKINHLLC